MKRPLKAALLSALVFPGSGHLYLKQFKRGAGILVTTFVCISILVVSAVKQALSIVEQLKDSGGAIDINKINELAIQSSQNSDSLFTQIALYLLIICWGFALIDAYRLANSE